MPITSDELPTPINEFEERLIQWTVDELNHAIEFETPSVMNNWVVDDCGCLLSTALSRHNENVVVNKMLDLINTDICLMDFGVKITSEEQGEQFRKSRTSDDYRSRKA